MSEPIKIESLSADELRLLQAFRALPEGPVRDKVQRVVKELIFYVENPRCQGLLPEGYPCGDPRSTCEECHRIWDTLEHLEGRMNRP